MTTAKLEAKAARLLVEGRVRLSSFDAGRLTFVVVGDSGEHRVVREPGRWSCSCPCWGRCSHLEAVLRVAP